MSTFVLKIIACVCMLIDHITIVMIPHGIYIWQTGLTNASDEFAREVVLYTIGRGIGRIAFPIFCYVLVEGFFHTRNIKKYFLRLGVLALVSEVPFDMMLTRSVFSMYAQNVLITLILGLTAVFLIEEIKKRWPLDVVRYNLLSCLVILGTGCLAQLLSTDYGMFGVMLILTFYMLRGRKFWALVMTVVLVAVFKESVSVMEFGAALAFPFIFLHNGKKGTNDKYAFYAFYPVHLLVLGLIRMFV